MFSVHVMSGKAKNGTVYYTVRYILVCNGMFMQVLWAPNNRVCYVLCIAYVLIALCWCWRFLVELYRPVVITNLCWSIVGFIAVMVSFFPLNYGHEQAQVSEFQNTGLFSTARLHQVKFKACKTQCFSRMYVTKLLSVFCLFCHSKPDTSFEKQSHSNGFNFTQEWLMKMNGITSRTWWPGRKIEFVAPFAPDFLWRLDEEM